MFAATFKFGAELSQPWSHESICFIACALMHCKQKDTSQKSQTAAPHEQQTDEEDDEARVSLSPIRSSGQSN